MRNIREILRLRLGARLKDRQISQSTKVSVDIIMKLLSRAEEPMCPTPPSKTLKKTLFSNIFHEDIRWYCL